LVMTTFYKYAGDMPSREKPTSTWLGQTPTSFLPERTVSGMMLRHFIPDHPRFVMNTPQPRCAVERWFAEYSRYESHAEGKREMRPVRRAVADGLGSGRLPAV